MDSLVNSQTRGLAPLPMRLGGPGSAPAGPNNRNGSVEVRYKAFRGVGLRHMLWALTASAALHLLLVLLPGPLGGGNRPLQPTVLRVSLPSRLAQTIHEPKIDHAEVRPESGQVPEGDIAVDNSKTKPPSMQPRFPTGIPSDGKDEYEKTTARKERKARFDNIMQSQREVGGMVPDGVDADIFAPEMRRGLARSRRLMAPFEGADPAPARPQVAELRTTSGYTALRIGERCWMVPDEPDIDDRVPRLWMLTSECPDAAPQLTFRKIGSKQ